MNSFVEFLTEADYLRFLKKNKNLTDDQREEINDYFSKDNTHAAGEIKWQDRKLKKLDYDYFENIMLRYKSGFRKKIKVNVPGRKGEDYWQIKLKSKTHLAYIPLNQEMAQYFNSAKFGVCATGHCIGYPDDPDYWDEHMIDEQEVPVYVIDGRGKWVVIIEDSNRRYQVWDKFNKTNIAFKEKEPIPGFSIQKELMNGKVKMLYNDIRDEFYTVENRHEEPEPDYGDARVDYDSFVNDIEDAQTELENARENQTKEMKQILDDTLEKYQFYRDKFLESYQKWEEKLDHAEKAIQAGPDSQGKYTLDGDLYGEKELKDRMAFFKERFDDTFEEWNKYDDAYDELNTMDTWEMHENHDEYDWTDEVPDEEGQYAYEQNMTIPSINNYDDYADFIEDTQLMPADQDRLTQAIWSYIYEGGYDASQVLANEGYYRP